MPPDAESARTPRWVLNVWDYRGRYSPELKRWEGWTEWEHVEVIEPAFTEPFYAFLKDDDYYFVTESGKLYLARKPAEGPRKMEPVWAGADWPIRAILTDADRGRTYLFARRTEGDTARHVYFELAERPDPKPFDPTALKPVKAEGDLGIILRYAQLLAPPEK